MATFLKLNDKQSFALGKVIKEHNVAITGQAGTGKSFLIRNCVEELDRMDRKRAVLCREGIKAGTNVRNLGPKSGTKFCRHINGT